MITSSTTPQIQVKFQKALGLLQQGQPIKAQALCEEILNLQPRHFEALHLLGVIAYQTKDHQKAIELIGKAIEINPGNPVFYSNHGIALQELKKLEEALASYNQAIAIKPDYADAHFNRGVVLKELKQLDASIASYEQAIAFKPDYAEAYFNRGNVLQELKQWDKAVSSYNKAVMLKPDFTQAIRNRVIAFHELKKQQISNGIYSDEIFNKPKHIKHLSGLCRFDIVNLLNGHQNIGIELGVAKGVFSKQMIESKKFSSFYGVDLYGDHHNTSEYINTIKHIGINENYKLFRMRFDEALNLFEDEYFDFIYVDGYAHTGENDGKTMHDWYKKLKTGGIIAGDDYHFQWPLVVEQVHKFINMHGLELLITDITEPDSVWSKYPTWAAFKK
jgi:tetratricopeptide (TPR) repeat protein